MSLSKTFPVWERTKFELRMEAYNVPNHPSWANHGYWWTTTDPNWGTINMIYDQQTNVPRTVQLSGKILW